MALVYLDQERDRHSSILEVDVERDLGFEDGVPDINGGLWEDLILLVRSRGRLGAYYRTEYTKWRPWAEYPRVLTSMIAVKVLPILLHIIRGMNSAFSPLLEAKYM